MRVLRLIVVVLATVSLSGCFLLPKTPISLNGTTMLFGKLESVTVTDADSVQFSSGRFGGGTFVVRSSKPIVVNGQEVTVSGSEVSIGGNSFQVDENWQVVVDRNGGIKLEHMKTKVISAAGQPEAE